jgi:flagellar assembly protein FliH
MTAMANSLFDTLAGLSSEAQPFSYRPVGDMQGDRLDAKGTELFSQGERTLQKENTEAIRRALEADFQTREKHARDQGFKEGQSAVRAEVDREVAAFRDALSLALKQFATEREDYYHSVEGHVVKLALAIARKILHREAQIDPLLLSGAVRVALEKVSSATLVCLYVHPDQVQTWKEFLARQNDISQKPEVLGDPAAVKGQCRVESSIGSADLSLESQITEIERGFFDLLAQRPEKP